MIPLKEIAEVLNPSGARYMALFRFYCDESYDSDPALDPANIGLAFHQLGSKPHVPRAYVVGGVFAGESAWTDIEKQWAPINMQFGVGRYHAAQVNAREGEFKDWLKDKQRDYSKALLDIVLNQGRKIHAISCGMLPREYRAIISEEGRRKLGHPYLACFKSAIALIAQEMEFRRHFGPDDKFAVILDRNEHENEAVEIFYKMKDSKEWPFHRRLATCAPGGWEDHLGLQPADLIAYETYRILADRYDGKYNDDDVRPFLRRMFSTNGFLGYYFEPWAFNEIKEHLENIDCVPNGFILNFPAPEPPDEQ
ncbi:MAG TPA: DUF3800 domain-containing protein [Terriglobia bacterium]|jgi:hypothetical protein